MRAKSHDQRKGQWLINKIRSDPEFKWCNDKDYEKYGFDACMNMDKAKIEMLLWNMENDEFDKMMGDYND